MIKQVFVIAVVAHGESVIGQSGGTSSRVTLIKLRTSAKVAIARQELLNTMAGL